MDAQGPNLVFVDGINLMRTSDLLKPFSFKDTEGLVRLLFPEVAESAVSEFARHSDIQKKISERAIFHHSLVEMGLAQPDVEKQISEMMGVSTHLPSPGIQVIAPGVNAQAGSYNLSWNFYLYDGGVNLTPLHEDPANYLPFSGNDLYAGFFLEFKYEERVGIPLSQLFSAVDLFSAKTIKSSLGQSDAGQTVQSLSAFFGGEAGVPFDPVDQAGLLVRLQANGFLDQMGSLLAIKTDEHERVMIELHSAVMDSFEKLYPTIKPSTILLPGHQPKGHA